MIKYDMWVVINLWYMSLIHTIKNVLINFLFIKISQSNPYLIIKKYTL